MDSVCIQNGVVVGEVNGMMLFDHLVEISRGLAFMSRELYAKDTGQHFFFLFCASTAVFRGSNAKHSVRVFTCILFH